MHYEGLTFFISTTHERLDRGAKTDQRQRAHTRLGKSAEGDLPFALECVCKVFAVSYLCLCRCLVPVSLSLSRSCVSVATCVHLATLISTSVWFPIFRSVVPDLSWLVVVLSVSLYYLSVLLRRSLSFSLVLVPSFPSFSAVLAFLTLLRITRRIYLSRVLSDLLYI